MDPSAPPSAMRTGAADRIRPPLPHLPPEPGTREERVPLDVVEETVVNEVAGVDAIATRAVKGEGGARVCRTNRFQMEYG